MKLGKLYVRFRKSHSYKSLPVEDNGLGLWVWSFSFEGDDEPGDPSGLHMIIFGYILEVYWPMNFGFFFTGGLYSLKKWRFVRFQSEKYRR